MEKVVRFSVLGYYPSLVTDENINVGILFHDVNHDERFLYTTSNWKRLAVFDDELDVDFLKTYLAGMKNDIDRNLFSSSTAFSMETFVGSYVNELRFGEIRSAYVDNVAKFIEQTKKICMRFDFEKKERVQRDSEISYIKRLLRDDQVVFGTRAISGHFEESVKFDFIIDRYGFKYFSFEGKTPNRMVSTVKSWAFTAESLKDKYKTVFVIDGDQPDSDDCHVLVSILKQNAEVITGDKVIDFILSIPGRDE